jgi:hypothetical protein
MTSLRVHRTRARRRGSNGPPVRRAGPRPSATVGPRSAQQRLRRLTSLAATMALEVVEHLQRLEVFAVQKAEEASDIARLVYAHAEMTNSGLPESGVAACLVLDWACRSPELTATFVMVARELNSRSRSSLDMLGRFRKLAASKQWRTYWKGPTRLNLQKFVQNADLQAIASFADVFVSGKRPRSTRLVRQMQKWKYLDKYLSFSLIRALAATTQTKLRDVETFAVAMSANTSELAKIISFEACRSHLRSKLGSVPSDALLAYYYCETVKVLRSERLLAAMSSYRGDPESFAKALVSPSMKEFLELLRHLQPGHLSDNSETELLNAVAPAARLQVHHSTDAVRRWRALRDAAG